jgi:hypothetical protein
LMSKKQWNDFSFHFFLWEDIEHGLRFIPADDLRVLWPLR